MAMPNATERDRTWRVFGNKDEGEDDVSLDFGW